MTDFHSINIHFILGVGSGQAIAWHGHKEKAGLESQLRPHPASCQWAPWEAAAVLTPEVGSLPLQGNPGLNSRLLDKQACGE